MKSSKYFYTLIRIENFKYYYLKFNKNYIKLFNYDSLIKYIITNYYINKYLTITNLSKTQISTLNKLRELIGLGDLHKDDG